MSMLLLLLVVMAKVMSLLFVLLVATMRNTLFSLPLPMAMAREPLFVQQHQKSYCLLQQPLQH
jgi:hypothetical protein